jgi:hypothetical protein
MDPVAEQVHSGINSLYDVLRRVPQIEYLTLEGFPHPNLLPSMALHLPNLVVLRLVRANRILSGRIGLWSLPCLKHVIVEQLHRNESLVELFIAHPKIQTVEQGQHLTFLVNDCLSFIMRWTHITELAYRLFFTRTPEDPTSCPTLKVVHWHSTPNMALDNPSSHAVKHVRVLQNAKLFPSLQRLILHGDWRELSHDIDIDLCTLRTEREVQIEFSDD